MSPEEIIEAYNVVTQDLKNQVAQESAAIGNSQRSLGTLAAAVASPSGQTSGLANYTYNRLLRPTVDTLAANLETTGKAEALQNKLTADLMAAKNNYENAKNAYTVASTAPKTTTPNPYTEVEDTAYSGEQIPYTEAGTIIGTSQDGNGIYTVTIADGKGGFYTKQVQADSSDTAKKKVTVIGTGSSGNGVYDVILSDGTRKQYFANSSEEAKQKYYKDNYSW